MALDIRDREVDSYCISEKYYEEISEIYGGFNETDSEMLLCFVYMLMMPESRYGTYAIKEDLMDYDHEFFGVGFEIVSHLWLAKNTCEDEEMVAHAIS